MEDKVMYDALIIDPGTIEGRASASSIHFVMEELDRLPLCYALKVHPGMVKRGSLYGGLFENAAELPGYIPVELFFQFVKKFIISVLTQSLIIASKFDNLTAVSLLELVEWVNQSYKNEIKKWLLDESDNRILFPRSIFELKAVLMKDFDNHK